MNHYQQSQPFENEEENTTFFTILKRVLLKLKKNGNTRRMENVEEGMKV